MNRVRSNFFAFAVGLCLPAVSFAKGSPQAVEIITKANAVAQKLTAIAYEGQFRVEGDFVDKLPQVTGKVIARRGEPGKGFHLLIQGTTQAPGETQATSFRFATDGEQAFKVEEQKKLYISGKLADARVSEVDALFPPKYFGDAFKNELSSQTATHEGVRTIDGVECDVVKITADPSGNRSMLYFIGKNDSLLHRVENTIRMMMPGASTPSTGRVIFNAKGLDTQPKTDGSMFRLPCPDGYRSEIFQGSFTNAPQTEQGFLAAGSQAPDWELKTPDGKVVSLKSLRGKVVVMDFWSSWCGPCKMAMPGLQKVHEQFKDKPVAILGINCRERSPDGEKKGLEFVRQKGLTYTQLMKGDSVEKAYKVGGIPCFYIIGPEGKVIYATSGFQPRLHEYMSQLIEKSLPAQPRAAAAPEAKSPAIP